MLLTVDASEVQLTDLGDFEDLEKAKAKQDAALNTIKTEALRTIRF